MRRFKLSVLAAFVTLVLVPLSSSAQDKVPLRLVQAISLPGLKEGDFDHFAVDVEGHRLFLAAEKNGAVEVFDTGAGRVVHTITGLDEPHSLLFRKDVNRLFVVDGGAAAVRVYDAQSYQPVGQIGLTADADSMAYDPNTNDMYVVNGGREEHTPYSLISVVDTNSLKKLRDIKIDSDRVEALVLEKSGPRMFCNITGKNTIGVVDRSQSSLLTTWPLPGGETENVAMTLDEADHRLFVVTRKPPKLVVLDSQSGKVVARLPSPPLVDDITYDAGSKRLYLAGDQFVDVFEQKDADHYRLLARVPGSFRAKTAILVPELNRYYLAVPRHRTRDAAVRVYAVQP